MNDALRHDVTPAGLRHPPDELSRLGNDDRLGTLGPRAALALLAVFVAAAVFHTWPLASAPGGLSRHDNADALLNEWALAWVAHQLPRNPLALFDANIFHPEADTLAYSEHLFVQGSLGMPLRAAGLSTTVVHNVLIITGFVLTGWCMALVMRRWRDDWWAAILGGLLLAFNAHSLSSPTCRRCTSNSCRWRFMRWTGCSSGPARCGPSVWLSRSYSSR